jgi:hypothetical protein
LIVREGGDTAIAMKPSSRTGRAIGVAGVVWTLAGACGGGGSAKAPTYTPVSATVDGDVYTLTVGPLKMVVDGGRGARITGFSYDGADVLVSRDVNGTNYGATYWPSPQSSWCAAGGACWPPIAAIDTQPYTGGIDDANSVTLTSAAASIAGFPGSAVTVTKQLTPVPESGAIDVAYTLTNASPSVAVSVAPWQVSRVATGGLTLFGQGTGSVTYAADSDPSFTVTDAEGDRWYASGPVSLYSKAFADGTGWLGQVTPDRLLYLQSFPDIQPNEAAPGEAEVEIFTNGDYVEIEPQGALTTVAPGASLDWTIRWKLRPLPAGTTVAAGNAGMASFAADTLAE